MSQLLIIDDNNDLRTLLKDYFEALDYEVLEASSGRQGLEVLKAEGEIGAVITDIIMPDMNGLDMIRALRKFNRRMPVLVMSGYEEELAQVKRLGVHGTFSKPPNLEEIKNLVELVLRKETA